MDDYKFKEYKDLSYHNLLAEYKNLNTYLHDARGLLTFDQYAKTRRYQADLEDKIRKVMQESKKKDKEER